LFVGGLGLAASAGAQDDTGKKPKKVKAQGSYHPDWGRRLDLTGKFRPIHPHPYVKM
jgi:hypothetical protein